MKKVFLTLILTILPLLASAEAVEIDGIWYNLVPKAKEAEVTNNPNGYSGRVEIPKSVMNDGIEYKVTSIGEGAFSNCSLMTSVIIPNSVTSIGERAFYNCSSLTSVNIPNSVTSIGENAFYRCSGLTSVYISDLSAWCGISYSGSCYYSPYHLYLNGEEIKDLTIPDNITSIRSYAFYNCSSLTSVTIPNSVTSISNSAFRDCSGLTSITIPNSVASIGSYAFNGCGGLTSITIPNSVTSIGYSTFYGCCGLTSVTIPRNVTSIEGSAFEGCSGLTTVTIPSSVTSIRNYAFFGSGLNSVTIPNSVTYIGEQTFAKCGNLTDVYCMAEKLGWAEDPEGLITSDDVFKDSYPQAITLHVPAASIEAYRSMEPWNQFKAIVPIEEGDIPETPKCAIPVISFVDGKVSITCETEGAEFVSDVTVADAKKYYDSEFNLSQTYKITVYAVKTGYDNSDVVTREIVIDNGQSSLFGDLNKDGKVDVADHVKLSDIIMNK